MALVRWPLCATSDSHSYLIWTIIAKVKYFLKISITSTNWRHAALDFQFTLSPGCSRLISTQLQYSVKEPPEQIKTTANIISKVLNAWYPGILPNISFIDKCYFLQNTIWSMVYLLFKICSVEPSQYSEVLPNGCSLPHSSMLLVSTRLYRKKWDLHPSKLYSKAEERRKVAKCSTTLSQLAKRFKAGRKWSQKQVLYRIMKSISLRKRHVPQF